MTRLALPVGEICGMSAPSTHWSLGALTCALSTAEAWLLRAQGLHKGVSPCAT